MIQSGAGEYVSSYEQMIRIHPARRLTLFVCGTAATTTAFLLLGYWMIACLGFMLIVAAVQTQKPLQTATEALFHKRADALGLRPIAELSDQSLGLFFAACKETGRILMMSSYGSKFLHECFVSANAICFVSLEVETHKSGGLIATEHKRLDLISELSEAYDVDTGYLNFGRKRSLEAVLAQELSGRSIDGVRLKFETQDLVDFKVGGLLYAKGTKPANTAARLKYAEKWCLFCDDLCRNFEVLHC